MHTIIFHLLLNNTEAKECLREKIRNCDMGRFVSNTHFFRETYFHINAMLELKRKIKFSKCHLQWKQTYLT